MGNGAAGETQPVETGAACVPCWISTCALDLQRKVNRDHTVHFLGRAWPLGHTRRKSVTVVHHPEQCFWVISEPSSRHRSV